MRKRAWLPAAAGIRTVGFLFATIPLLMGAAVVGLLTLVLVSPLIVYSSLTGKHIKDPFRQSNSLLK
jgi:hypothetical protein